MGRSADAAWPDRTELQRWERDADSVARRIRDERGVEEPVAVSSGPGALWVTFGERRVRVAGADADVHDEHELFEDLDAWVAFDRDAGPGRVLDRDRAVFARVLDRMPVAQALWTAAVQRVLDDLHATTHLTWTYALVVHQDEPAWPRLPPSYGAYVSGLEVHLDPTEQLSGADPWGHLPRRLLPLPQLWLECDAGWSSWVDESEDDPEVICRDAADRIADEAIDELWGAWPRCPRHSHPLETVLSDGQACWACPADEAVVAPVGALACAGAPPDRTSAG